jgi:antitoxin (DNA-binding transcriptional repressor) of toxin-antitoxin stability system
MQYTIIELETFLDELMMAAWSGEEVIITRNGKPIAQLVHRGPQIKLRSALRLAAISNKKDTPSRFGSPPDLGFEE